MKKILGILGGLSALFLIWFIVVRPAIADVYLKQMESVNLESRFAQYEIQDLHSKIIFNAQFTSAEIPYRYRYVNLLIKLAFLKDNYENQNALFQKALEELDYIYHKNPNGFNYYPTLGELMKFWGKIDPTKYQLMDQAFGKAITNGPNYAPFYYWWGEGLKESGNYSKAKEKLFQALVLFPSPDSPGVAPDQYHNLGLIRSEIYQQLGEVEQLEGDALKAEYYFQNSQAIKEMIAN